MIQLFRCCELFLDLKGVRQERRDLKQCFLFLIKMHVHLFRRDLCDSTKASTDGVKVTLRVRVVAL